jgi:hypothetical protein
MPIFLLVYVHICLAFLMQYVFYSVLRKRSMRFVFREMVS